MSDTYGITIRAMVEINPNMSWVGLGVSLEVRGVMGVDLYIVDERDQPQGKPWLDRMPGLYLFLPAWDDERFHVLRFIDEYGNTIFNRYQAERFLVEWKWVRERAESPEALTIWRNVRAKAHYVARTNHLYLKFDGD
jgi:cation diffusion facilitator CzcD-associated flavoprotein CzcO